MRNSIVKLNEKILVLEEMINFVSEIQSEEFTLDERSHINRSVSHLQGAINAMITIADNQYVVVREYESEYIIQPIKLWCLDSEGEWNYQHPRGFRMKKDAELSALKMSDSQGELHVMTYKEASDKLFDQCEQYNYDYYDHIIDEIHGIMRKEFGLLKSLDGLDDKVRSFVMKELDWRFCNKQGDLDSVLVLSYKGGNYSKLVDIICEQFYQNWGRK